MRRALSHRRVWVTVGFLSLVHGPAPGEARSAESGVSAQVGAGSVIGRVVDEAGAPVPGAAIMIVEARTALTRTTAAAPDGRYTITTLPPGAYTVRVEAKSFRPIAREGVQVVTGDTVRVDVVLQVGGIGEEITVVADAPLVRVDTSGLGQIIDSLKVTSLPLNGRSFVVLTGLAPGVALPPGSSLPRINGGRPRTNEYLFDGISVLQPEPGQVAFFPNVDAVQEFKVESNSPQAEFGRFNGGVVNLTTKSGSNDWHGTLFEFFRHERLNARNYFASTSAMDPKFRRDQFGGVLGGPIRPNRMFFFVDYQRQRQAVSRVAISTVPTVLQRQGIFTETVAGRVPVIYDPLTTVTGAGGTTRTAFTGNTIPAGRIDPVAVALLARYPLPMSEGTANNFRRIGIERNDQDQFSARVDRRVGETGARVFGRLTRFHERFAPVAPLPDGSGISAGTLGPQRTRAWSLASNYLRPLSDRMLNELRVGDTRRSVERSAAGLPASVFDALGLPGIPPSARFPRTLPAMLIAGYQQLGSPPNTATSFATGVTQIADTFTWLNGRHTIKAGADIRWSRLNVVQPPSPAGAFTFTSLFTDLPGVSNTGFPLASFLLGQVQQFSIDLQRDAIRNRAHVQEYFVQDDWRLSARIVVNAGVRYTLNFPSTEANDQAAVFNLLTGQLEYLGRDGHPRSARRLHKMDFGPRLGVVVRVTDRLVARTGYALIRIEQAGITTPFTTPAFPFVQTISQRTLDNITPALILAEGPRVEPIALTVDAGDGQGVFAVNRDLGSGYAQQWNASVQREITPDVALEVAYIGSKIARVGVPDTNLNQLTVEQLAQGPALLERVPNPYLGIIPRSSSLGDPAIPVAQLLKKYPRHTTVSLYRNNVGTTQYHGVSAKLEQRFSGGLSYLISYTRSKLVDDASSVFDATIQTGPLASYPVADSFNRRLERDYSSGDIPHAFVVSAVWNIPAGRGRRLWARGLLGALVNDWTLTGILTLQSGTPVAVTQATNTNAFAGFGTQRPNLVGDPELPAAKRSTSRWFNTSAFAPAPQFTIGTSSRNPVRGPAYRNFDVAIIRRLPLASSRAFELRAEIFNVTNTPPLGQPDGIFGSAAFGSITTAGDPRVVQLALKFSF